MNNKSTKILTEISPGELLDKISILEIKLMKIKDKEKLDEVNKEYKSLLNTKNTTIKTGNELEDLILKIKNINLKLWETEDKIRFCEKNKSFGDEFIQLARDVYIDNDERARLKLSINKLLGSNFIEIKDYSSYK
jgi:hypothetical protein|tara:strand:+ start:638 stop:1042 length:405 start_codon:yes stop_codon:yes gene_type:complete